MTHVRNTLKYIQKYKSLNKNPEKTFNAWFKECLL